MKNKKGQARTKKNIAQKGQYELLCVSYMRIEPEVALEKIPVPQEKKSMRFFQNGWNINHKKCLISGNPKMKKGKSEKDSKI